MVYWENHFPFLIATLIVLAFAGAIVLFLLFAYHAARTTQEPKGKKEDIFINLLAPFSMFLPGLHSPKGEHHKRRMILFLALLLLCLAVLFSFKIYMDGLEVQPTP